VRLHRRSPGEGEAACTGNACGGELLAAAAMPPTHRPTRTQTRNNLERGRNERTQHEGEAQPAEAADGRKGNPTRRAFTPAAHPRGASARSNHILWLCKHREGHVHSTYCAAAGAGLAAGAAAAGDEAGAGDPEAAAGATSLAGWRSRRLRLRLLPPSLGEPPAAAAAPAGEPAAGAGEAAAASAGLSPPCLRCLSPPLR